MTHAFVRLSAVATVALFALASVPGVMQAASLFEQAVHGPTDPSTSELSTSEAMAAPPTGPAHPAPNLRIIDNGLEVPVVLEVARVQGQTVEQVLSQLGFVVAPEDVVYPARTQPVPLFGSVFVSRAPGVVVVADDEVREVKTRAVTVAGVLSEQGVTVDDDDEVSPDTSAAVTPNLRIVVTRVEIQEAKEQESIAFETDYKDDATLYVGESKVVTAGAEGTKEVTFEVRYEDGTEVSRKAKDEQVVKQPVTQVIARGTKPQPTQVSSGPYRDEINAAAAQFGVSASDLMNVMMCESGGNPNAVGGGGQYYGLFQFSKGMWSESWNDWRSSSIMDPHAQIHAAAKAFSLGMRGRWGC